MTTARTLCLLAVALTTLGCNRHAKVSDPLSDLRNPALPVRTREIAINKSWQMAKDGTLDRTAVREDLKTVAWSRHWTLSLRLAALDALLSDTDEKGLEDTRGMVRLMLPRETEPRVTQALAAAAARNGWKETTPALVRSLSILWPNIADAARPETAAIATLNPGEKLETIVYRVFQNPPEDSGTFGLVPAERVRADAWNLLNRLDPDGSLRTQLVTADPSTSGPAEDIRTSLRDLRIMPITGEELAWLSSLRNNRTPAYTEWWDQTTKVAASLDAARTGTLRLRHLEPVRWASTHHTEWLAATQDQLLNVLHTRLDTRKHYRRTEREPGLPKPGPQGLDDWQATLSWGDLLTLLVVEEALRQRDLATALFAQAAMDMEDRTAEYGGILRAEPAGTFSVILFPPRPGSRRGDNEFVASTDMFTQSDHAIGHYHFHAQDTHNSSYAGPSNGDLAYSARYGRTCLVFTWASSNVLNADVYTPDGAVIDMGEVTKP